MRFLSLVKSTVQEKTQNFAICWSDYSGTYMVYENPQYKDDYLLHPYFAQIPTHLTTYSFTTEVTIYNTTNSTMLEESTRSCPDSCTNTPTRRFCPNTPAVIKTSLLTHPFPCPTSTFQSSGQTGDIQDIEDWLHSPALL